MNNPFVSPVSAQERVKHAQVCPHCFAQVFTVWGDDLRVRGNCPQCSKVLYRYRGAIHSRREALALLVGLGVPSLAVVGWVVYALCI
jgi:hypothetical protein